MKLTKSPLKKFSKSGGCGKRTQDKKVIIYKTKLQNYIYRINHLRIILTKEEQFAKVKF